MYSAVAPLRRCAIAPLRRKIIIKKGGYDAKKGISKRISATDIGWDRFLPEWLKWSGIQPGINRIKTDKPGLQKNKGKGCKDLYGNFNRTMAQTRYGF